MFNWLLRQQPFRPPPGTPLPILPPPPQTDPQRRPHNIIEQERAVNQQREAKDLQPFERLPPQRQRHQPDEQRAARVDGRARRGADGARYGEAEEIEAAALWPGGGG